MGGATSCTEDFVCSCCSKQFFTYSALQLHMVAQHGWYSELSAKIDTVFCPGCLLHFSSRMGVMVHIYKQRSGICRRNVRDFPIMPTERVAELIDADTALRQKLLAEGKGKEKRDIPAVRQLGPYRVRALDGSLISNKNGHPLAESGVPWRRARYYETSRGIQLVKGVCIASHFQACKRQCVLCKGSDMLD